MTIAPSTEQKLRTASPYHKAISACQLGQLETAKEWAEKAIESKDHPLEACILLGQLYQGQSAFAKAREYYKRAAELDSDSAVPEHYLGSSYSEEGMLNISLYHFLKALARKPDQLISRQQLVATLGKMPFISNVLFTPQMEKELLLCFDSPEIKHRGMFGVSLGFIRNQAGFADFRKRVIAQDAAALSEPFIDLLRYPVFLHLLQKIFNFDLKFEQFLSALRSILLRHVLQSLEQEQEIHPTLRDFIFAMATQVFINEYIWSISEEEEQLLEQLKQGLRKQIANDASSNARVLLCLMTGLMYQSPEHFPEAVALDWSTFSIETKIQERAVEQCLLNEIEEQKLMEQLPSFAPITQTTSLIVQQQYESYPYPRWLSFDLLRSLPFSDWIKVNFAFSKHWSEIAQMPPEVLVAGCGTGNHALTVGNQFTDAKVIAIDLSRRSLGYAMRMAHRYQADNIHFVHGDLLEVQKLGQRFSIIECAGTLHHMAEPMKGWQALCEVLRPGGLMKIGLYSATARRKLSQFREMAEAQHLSKDHEAMCAFRNQLLQNQDHPDLPVLLNIADFFTYNAFQDLLFHPQEHCFSIPQIADCLRQLGLQFLGFTLDAKVTQAFKKMFPDKTIFDLETWAQFEEQHPDTFIAMYQFWCRKPSTSED